MNDFINWGVEEMCQHEMLNVEGGNIFEDAWNGIKSFFQGLCDGLKGV